MALGYRRLLVLVIASGLSAFVNPLCTAQPACLQPRQLITEAYLSNGPVVEFRDKVYFPHNDSLWQSDGRSGTEVMVALPEDTTLIQLVGATKSHLFILCSDDVLYAWDGIDESMTAIESGLGPPVPASSPSTLRFFAYRMSDELIVFRKPYSTVVASDGTAEGTYILRDFGNKGIDPTSFFLSEIPFSFATVPGGFIFCGYDRPSRFEPWFSAGTPSETRLLADLVPLPTEGEFVPPNERWLYSSFPFNLYSSGDFAFIQDDSTANKTWRTDGTEEGTTVVPAIDAPRVAVLGDFQYGHDGEELVRVRLSNNEVEVVHSHESDIPRSVNVRNVTQLGAGVIYNVFSELQPELNQVWFSDAGTMETYPLLPEMPLSVRTEDHRDEGPFYVVNDVAYFFAHTEAHGAELWSSDGSPSGTRRITDINPGEGNAVFHSASYGVFGVAWLTNGRLYFRAGDGLENHLWSYEITQRPNYAHSADTNKNYIIELSELLRVIQFFNSDGLHIDESTEDGYAIGPGNRDGEHHDSDYIDADWRIDLSELLRIIQLYNAPDNTICTQDDSEDGFAI